MVRGSACTGVSKLILSLSITGGRFKTRAGDAGGGGGAGLRLSSCAATRHASLSKDSEAACISCRAHFVAFFWLTRAV